MSFFEISVFSPRASLLISKRFLAEFEIDMVSVGIEDADEDVYPLFR